MSAEVTVIDHPLIQHKLTLMCKVVAPMLATGNLAVVAIDRLKQINSMSLNFICLLAAPEGIKHFHEQHLNVQIYTTAINQKLDNYGYMIARLGDTGDRLFGTQ